MKTQSFLTKSFSLTLFSVLLSSLLIFACKDSNESSVSSVNPAPTLGNAQSGSTPAQYTYMITNRANLSPSDGNDTTEVVPLPPGALFYLTRDGGNDTSVTGYKDLGSTEFLDRLSNDLNSVCNKGITQLSIFVHGLSTPWDTAKHITGLYGQNLYGNGWTNGVLVGFSWPAYASLPSLDSINTDSGLTEGVRKQVAYYSKSYIQTDTSRTTRANIHGSVLSFTNMLDTLMTLKDRGLNCDSLQVNLIAHSEGNYMVMQGINSLVGTSDNIGGYLLDQVLLLAPDINDAAFTHPANLPESTGKTGDAGAIATYSRFTTIYFSCWDDILDGSLSLSILAVDPADSIPDLHNPIAPGRLGLTGPDNYDELISNVAAINCYEVNNPTQMDSLQSVIFLPGTSPHISYLYVPQLVADQASTLNANTTSGNSISGRVEALKDLIIPMSNLFCLFPPGARDTTYHYNDLISPCINTDSL